MAELGTQIVDAVLAACQAGAAEASAGFSRALDSQLRLSAGAPGTWDPGQDDWSGPGLAVLLKVGATGAAVLLPESSGLLPDWYAAPDATGKSKLATLAQELGMLLLPEELMPDDFQAARVANLSAAANRAGLVAGAPLLPLSLSDAGGKTATIALTWPLSTPEALYSESPTASQPPPPAAAPREPAPAASPTRVASPEMPPAPHHDVRELPVYCRSLLRIRVPVMVTLARKKQPAGRIVELVPGSILQFNKSCDELLDLEVGGRRVAQGECVKVGDKFGLRITSVTLPDERFASLAAGK